MRSGKTLSDLRATTALADRSARRGSALGWIFSAIVCPRSSLRRSAALFRREVIMIAAPTLEIAVIILGTGLILARSIRGEDRETRHRARSDHRTGRHPDREFLRRPHAGRSYRRFGIFTRPIRSPLFFKRFALVTTILVLVMMIDYAPIVPQLIHGATHQSGLGEFFALPLFTCAGLMWMASAIDFVMIFVSIELVSISFYVLVSFTRRNPATLEAGVKYLILSALSTGFLVYGITWIFGVTGETNLDRITALLTQRKHRTRPGAFRNGASCWSRSALRSQLFHSKSGCPMFIKARRRR